MVLFLKLQVVITTSKTMLKFVSYLLCYLFYPFSFIIPRTDKILVFGSFWGGFNENSKYLYIYCHEHLKNRCAVWVSTKRTTVRTLREKGLPAYWVGSPHGIWFALRGKYWFVNSYTSDILFCLVGNAILVNLWHGLPWKCIEYGITKGALAKRYAKQDKWDVFYHPAPFRKPQYVLSSSPFITDIFSRSFRIPKSSCLEEGYPRDYLLTHPKDEVLQFIQKYESPDLFRFIERLRDYQHVYIYMPTWRDSQRNLFAGGMDLPTLNNVMREQNALMLMKPHPNTIIPNFAEYSNLIFLDNTSEVYCILPFTDVLISDYSSVMFDYAIMPNKGMILYQYDYESYIQDREFNFPAENNLIGRQVKSFEELIAVIQKKDYYPDETERKRFLDQFWGDTILLKTDVCYNILNRLQLLDV